MESSDKFVRLSHIIIYVLLLLSVSLNVYLLTKENEYKVIEKVRTEVVTDTISDTIPDIRYEKLVSYKRDTLCFVDTVPGDTVRIIAEIPISQKEYSDDSTYTAWVSGYNQNLDSINVYRKALYVTKDITRFKKQNFSIGPYVGYGYDIGNKKCGVSVGVGITYKVFGF